MHLESGNYLHNALEVLYEYRMALLWIGSLMLGVLVWSVNMFLERYAKVHTVEDLEKKTSKQHIELRQAIYEVKAELSNEIAAVKTEILTTILHLYHRDHEDDLK
jgi:hypothetical protein